MRGEVAEHFTTQFVYEDSGLAVTATSGVINQQGRAFTHAFEIHLERATLLFDFAVIDNKPELLTPFTVLDSKGKVLQPKLGEGDPMVAFEHELKEVARAVQAGKASPILDGQLARDAVVLCQKQTQSLQSGRAVRV
jgi:predicted dehydrogenase